MNTSATRLLLPVLVILVLAGCSARTGHHAIQPVEVSVPARWTASSEYSEEEISGWISHFSSPVLEALVKEALERNHDLRILAVRLDKAGAAARIEGAAVLPEISAGMKADRGSIRYGSDRDTEKTRAYGLSFNIGWELDVWGRLRDQAGAARSEMRAAEEDYKAGRLSLAANVARAWFDLASARLQAELARKTVETYEASDGKVRDRFERGIGSALDLRLSLAGTAASRDMLEQRKMDCDHAARNLQILLGRYPDARIFPANELPSVSRKIPAGLPSRLLERRPDIRASRLRLEASDMRVSAARKAFLPAFSLTGTKGISSDALKRITSTDYSVWNLAGNLVQPIFTGGKLKAGLEDAEADAGITWLEYGNAVLDAFREVEEALAAEAFLLQREDLLKEAVHQSAEAENLAWNQYLSGLVDIITVLDSRRRVLESRMNYLEVRRLYLQNRIDIYLALGGNLEVEK